MKMKLLATSDQMKMIDKLTIDNLGIPSLVLMENAATAIFNQIKKRYDKNRKFLIVCGNGNNAGDGLALARILYNNGYNVGCYLNNPHGKSDEFNTQLRIVKNMGIKCIDDVLITFIINDYDVIVDAIFGIGLNADVRDDYKFLINSINASSKSIIAVDIPSGINATTGKVMGVAVKADMTVTFGVGKLGLEIYPGKEYAGEIITEDIGFPNYIVKDVCKEFYNLEKSDMMLPERKDSLNKGSAGKVLIIAGSETYYGSLYFSAKACLRMGAGMVYIYTHSANKTQINSQLPEAIVYTYDSSFYVNVLDRLLNNVDAVLIGPGIGTSDISHEILNYTIKKVSKPLVIDADGINLLDEELLHKINNENVMITPHVMEMKRLCDKIGIDSNNSLIDIAKEFAENYKINLILKDCISLIPKDNAIYLNTLGNSALAKGGSGDILAGIVVYLVSRGVEPVDALKSASIVLGTLAETLSKRVDKFSILPSDILNSWSIYE